MSSPPPGYDDETTIPRLRLKSLLGDFGRELETIEKIFAQSVTMEYKEEGHDFSAEFSKIQETADELGTDYPFLIERLVNDYEHFKQAPDREKLEKLFSDVKSLQLLLTG